MAEPNADAATNCNILRNYFLILPFALRIFFGFFIMRDLGQNHYNLHVQTYKLWNSVILEYNFSVKGQAGNQPSMTFHHSWMPNYERF